MLLCQVPSLTILTTPWFIRTFCDAENLVLALGTNSVLLDWYWIVSLVGVAGPFPRPWPMKRKWKIDPMVPGGLASLWNHPAGGVWSRICFFWGLKVGSVFSLCIRFLGPRVL